MAHAAGQHGPAAADPPHLPHPQGQWPPGRCTHPGRVRVEDRGHAQPRARWQPRGLAGGAGHGRQRACRAAAAERRAAPRPAHQCGPAGHAGHCRSCRRR
ncbi:hypothetical protein G6F59_018260 [Rhizopus arrhizus]|uniref:Uncharacterized protein n=1 Tax=Rhizopus delemar TaxID=936053 RepID=A0A9P6XU96_9FUNG|nr:hypothetical protein G6F59_018260 [Rhizopus arrhizus]KAG1532664.1 hypothetical protein G6F50_016136 [Rhizopus delemar]